MRENFSIGKKIILGYLPKDSVNLVIPEEFINRNTGEINVYDFILRLINRASDVTIDYEVKTKS
jgi:hypothetical protein